MDSYSAEDHTAEGRCAENEADHANDLEGPIEIAITGDLTDHEGEITDRLLGVEIGGECTLYIDSPGGSPYCAMSLMTLIKLRRLRATAIVTGECSSATLWPFAACQRRFVTPYSVLLFHPMRWQSEENVGLAEAAEWARHFGDLEKTMDELLAQLFGVDIKLMAEWINPGRYVSGREVADAGIAEMVNFDDLPTLSMPASVDASQSPAGRAGASRPAARRSN
ncbi:MAG: ATP-dependent Clp protease proteolytic subunit [Planctomycetota bacterium]